MCVQCLAEVIACDSRWIMLLVHPKAVHHTHQGCQRHSDRLSYDPCSVFSLLSAPVFLHAMHHRCCLCFTRYCTTLTPPRHSPHPSRADPWCEEALSALIDNHMLTNRQELELIDSLPLQPQDRWLALLYRAKCKKVRGYRLGWLVGWLSRGVCWGDCMYVGKINTRQCRRQRTGSFA